MGSKQFFSIVIEQLSDRYANIRFLIGMKENSDQWKGGIAKNITFIVTKDCQLACKYCYLVGKNSKERMTFEIEMTSRKKVLYGTLLEENHSLK